ncbi:hypothetical protein [Pumilibacter intestinalis]|uniref:hypothetical protein n=1 Tax=Pumilibacter intestinalis TaxID=2941511 RepID=UPI00203FBEAE|nr:hypothetical protein [Pumilibacter intestinalis]
MNNIGDWQFYNHAWVPSVEPHTVPDLAPLAGGELFKQGGVLARYTTQFDCGNETEWWYIIKDKPFDISELKSKHRYVIKQGEKNFETKLINPLHYKEDIFQVATAAFADYPKKYRPQLQKDKFMNDIEEWSAGGGVFVYGAFVRNNGVLAGYAVLSKENRCLHFSILKTMPIYEKMQVNAALVYKILKDFEIELTNGYYICDGARNIQHQTHFPEYLEKYFGFRKAYCRLHVAYAPKYKRLIKLVYPFRKLLHLFDGITKVHQLNGVLKMEEIVRRQESENGKHSRAKQV